MRKQRNPLDPESNKKIILLISIVILFFIAAVAVTFVPYFTSLSEYTTDLEYARLKENSSLSVDFVKEIINQKVSNCKNVAKLLGKTASKDKASENKFYTNTADFLDYYVDKNAVVDFNVIKYDEVMHEFQSLDRATEPNGNDTATTIPTNAYFVDSFNGETNIVYNREAHKVYIITPVFLDGDDKQPIAILQAVYKPSIFANSDKLHSLSGATILTVDKSGYILNDTRSDYGKTSNIFSIMSLSEFESENGFKDLRENFDNNEESWTSKYKYESLSYYALFGSLNFNGWYSVLIYPIDIIDNQIQAQLSRTLLVEGVTVGLFIVILAFVLLYFSVSIYKFKKRTAKLQVMFNNMPGGTQIIRNDGDLTFISVSDGFLELVGYTKEQIKNKFDNKLMNLILPEDRETVKLSVAGQAEYSNRIDIQFRIKRSDGKIIWLFAQARLTIDEETNEEAMFCIVIDISDTKNTSELLHRTNEDFISLTNAIPGGVLKVAFNDNWDIEYANQGFYSAIGYTAEEIKKKFNGGFINLVVEEDREKLIESTYEQLKVSPSVNVEIRIKTKKSKIWVMFRAQKQFDDCGNIVLLSVLSNISNLKDATNAIAKEREKYKIIARLSNDTLFEYTRDDDGLTLTGDGIEGGTSYISNFVKNLDTSGVVYPSDIGIVRDFMKDIKETGEVDDIEFRVKLDDGEYKWVSVSAVVAYNLLIGKIVDVHQIKLEAESLKDSARRDPWTGLYNKKATEHYVSKFLDEEHSRHSESLHAFMIVDIDNFKSFNDTFGHMVGDQVLTSLSNEAFRLFRSSDILGRIGGDEFCFFIKDFPSVERVEEKVNELIDALANLKVGDGSVALTVSIGVSIYSKDGVKYKDLFSKADSALYEAKNAGKNCFRLSK